ncbi:MAG: DNA-directed RNA polymerase subunit alpha [candidate division WS6 bacterium 36_33]|uniref:DNA-directed RNA polymerase subunit alpha n=1 Tax=candidate division WS6 bacterium 36_33 TaxID=1641388 RepID=A0A101GZZ4_9BACT|nr:MAG: DNA-directed RNA polymerase subunit alpha [candidate division WS6 bacterium 36_33]
MEAFKDIRVTIKEEKDNYGLFEVSPLPRGYGHTLGNSLRRILYSSLRGTGVTAVEIKGVDHEYSTLDGVKETVVDIILNLKEVKFKTELDEVFKCKLDVKGKKIVTAGDIEVKGDLEVVNKNLVIAELTDASSELNMEITVESGVGYKRAEDAEREPVGLIPLDCDFTPIERVSLSVEQARKGQETDLDAVLLGVTTDGSIEPKEALVESSKILQEFAGKVMIAMGMSQKEVEELAEEANTPEETEEEAKEEEDEIGSWKIEDLPISKRSKTGLLTGGFKTVGDLRDTTVTELLNLPGFGNKSLNEVVELLSEYGIHIKGV